MMTQMKNQHPPDHPRSPSPRKIAALAGLAIAAIVLVGVLALLLFPDPCLNGFIKPRMMLALAGAFPAYTLSIGDMHYDLTENRLACDSVAVHAVDGSFSGSLGRFSVSGIDWIHLLRRGSALPEDFARSTLDAQEIMLTFPESQYTVLCQRLQISVPDSAIVVDTLALHPAGNDEQLFEGSRFRMTRFRLLVPHAGARGFACLELLNGKGYRTRSALIHELDLDVLMNKDKPTARDTSHIPMPQEILSSIQGTLRVDSLRIVNGRLNYGERFQVGSRPALITFDSIQFLATGITNRQDPGAAIAIRAQGQFMKAGIMTMSMTIPVASPGFSLQYSGRTTGYRACHSLHFISHVDRSFLPIFGSCRLNSRRKSPASEITGTSIFICIL